MIRLTIDRNTNERTSAVVIFGMDIIFFITLIKPICVSLEETITRASPTKKVKR